MKGCHRRRIDNVPEDPCDGRRETTIRVQRFDYWSYPAYINGAYVQFGGPQFLALLILSTREKVKECEKKMRWTCSVQEQILAGELSPLSKRQLNIPDRRIRGKRSARNIHTHTQADFTVAEILMKQERETAICSKETIPCSV